MLAAFLECAGAGTGITLGLALVAQEETKSQGTRDVLDRLQARGVPVAGAVFGEPTGLDLAVAQKGLIVLELLARGEAAHAAHARALGAPNAARLLARDLVALEGLELGEHPELGPTTLEPTVVSAGSARNVVPAEASAILDVRAVPGIAPEAIAAKVRAQVAGEVKVVSDRFAPRQTPAGSALLAAARAARPGARAYGSATLSDWALLPPTCPASRSARGARSARTRRTSTSSSRRSSTAPRSTPTWCAPSRPRSPRERRARHEPALGQGARSTNGCSPTRPARTMRSTNG